MKRAFASWLQVEDWLNQRGMFHIELGLERMTTALARLKLALPPGIQVLGTNGKGSTSAFIGSLATANGWRCGTYMSPHFVDISERILLNGRPAPKDILLAAANKIFDAAKDLEPTYFEFLTLVAAYVFSSEKLDLAIWEAGMGGRNDATTAIGCQTLCYTPIAMDHAQIIGPALADIAADKAAAIPCGGHVFSEQQFPLAARILEEEAKLRCACLRFVPPLADSTNLGLAGSHQFANAALALAAWRHVAPDASENADMAALANAFLPGRMQILKKKPDLPPLLLDGAHNPHGMAALLRSLEKNDAPARIIWSCLADKDWRPALGMLLRRLPDAHIHLVPLSNKRATPLEEMRKFCLQFLPPDKIHAASSLPAVLASLTECDKTTLLTGSLYLLAEFFSLYPSYLNAPSCGGSRGMHMSDNAYKPKAAWEIFNNGEDRRQMRDFAGRYIEFISSCKTERETIEYIYDHLKSAGYGDNIASGRFMRPLRGKALFAWRRGNSSTGLNLIASHVDCPRLDFKQHPIIEQAGVAQAKTHYYGGIRKYQWLARPLALHGVVVRENGEKVAIRIGEEPDEPVFCIADLLPHLAKKQEGKKVSEAFEGEKLNIVLAHEPETEDEDKTKEKVRKRLIDLLAQKYGIIEEDLITAEIEAVPAGPARFVGLDESMIGGYGQDDRICAFCSLEAMLAANPQSPNGQALIFWDKEEIGSDGATGASSRFLQYCLEDVAAATGVKASTLFLETRAISADVSAALDPDYQDAHEKQNAALLGYGPVFSKFTGSRGKYGASEADAEFFASLRGLFNSRGLAWQAAELGRIDLGGGGTVALFLAGLGINVIDLGPALLSMHSPFELSSVADLYSTWRAYQAFLES